MPKHTLENVKEDVYNEYSSVSNHKELTTETMEELVSRISQKMFGT